MSGALVDLVSKGVQDAYITGEPQVSFFRQNYRRHTNFAMRPEELNYIGTFAANSEVTIKIPSKGDLLSYVWIEAAGINDKADNRNNASIIEDNDSTLFEFSLYIGGQKVVTFDSLYLQGVHELLYRNNQARASCAGVTNTSKSNSLGYSGAPDYLVLPFFFGEDWTKALPLVALQYHEVEIRIKCRNGFTAGSTPKVWGNFIYLDTAERDFFVNTDHEILIEQVQHVLASNTDTDFDLTYFNHPVKAVHLVSGQAAGASWATEYNFKDSSFYINGTTLFDTTSNTYHHNVVHEMHCENLPDDTLNRQPTFTWPFCLSIGKYQPTGTLNFSRIDTAKLIVTSPTGGNSLHRVYGVNYNILRIKKGMAGVAFSN